jgi:hypothetical protein
MNIGIIDADLIYKQEHNFPNLACMKLSGYHKKRGDKVRLISYSEISPESLFIESFDVVYISKVFTSTIVPEHIINLPFVIYGGTGFYFDKAPNLPYEIEHCFPDYHLYDAWIEVKKKERVNSEYFKYYTDFSIGFTTRGCFRKCDFCVNQKYDKVFLHSPLSEFVDKNRKYICLYDDNFLACGEYWEIILKELIKTGKPFQFKGGLDFRLMSDKKAKLFLQCKYVGEYIFAFDNIADRELIERKISIWAKYFKTNTWLAKFYVLTGFDRQNKYDDNFWIQDIIDLFERIRILMKYGCLPYIMLFEKFVDSPFVNLYLAVRSWTNAPRIFYKQSFKEFHGNDFQHFENQFPEIAAKYFYMKNGGEVNHKTIVELSLF